MMQTLRTSDVLRCILMKAPKGPNLACSKESLTNSRPLKKAALWKQVLAQRRNRLILVWWNGFRLGGLASARTRAGRRVWEIDHLYLPAEDLKPQGNRNGLNGSGAATSLEILEQLVQLAGWQSAERIFLRLPCDSPAISLARRAGFFPSFEEILLEGKGEPAPNNGAGSAGDFRDRRPQDDFALFQLFSATTPAAVRAGLGLTFDQWRDAQELSTGKKQEWIAESNGRITGWLGLYSLPGATEGRVMARPEHPDLLPAMVKLALSRPGPQRWLVPDYQKAVSDQLHHYNFREAARCVTLIKTVAVPVMRPGMATVEA